MADLIVGKTNVTKLLRENYKKFGSGWIILIELPVDQHMNVNTEALKILTNEMNYDCVYITLSRTYEELNDSFKKGGVDTSRLYYIDAVSRMYGESKQSKKRCVYTSGPLDLETLTSSLKELLASFTSDRKCVLLDSITTLLLYNALPRTIRFSHFLNQTMKETGVDCIMLSVVHETSTGELVKELSTFCDEVITIK